MKVVLFSLLPVVLFLGLVFAFVKSAIYFYQRGKKGRKSPFTSNLLRAPGQSLSRQVEEMTEEIDLTTSFLFMLPFLFFSLLLAQVHWGALELSAVNGAIYSTMALAGMVILAVQLSRQLKKRNLLRLGLEAEMAVGQELNHLMRDGYYVYHDFPAEKFNIDHVAVGPGGVFAVETKGCSKPDKGRGSFDATVVFDGKTLKFPDWEERKYTEQARRQAVWFKNWLTSAIGEYVEARPVLALPGWFVDQKQKSDVIIYSGKNPQGWARAQGKSTLTENQIKRIKHQLEQRCRDVEPVSYNQEKKAKAVGK